MLIKKCSLFVILLAVATIASAQFSASRQSADLNHVIAVVDGHEVTLGEIQQILLNAPPQLAQQMQVEPKAAISDWYITQYLGQLGEERMLDQQSPVKEQLEAIRMTVLGGALVNNERDTYPVTSEMIQDYFDRHRTDYLESDVNAIWITFKPKVATTGTSADALQQAAQAALGGTRAQRSEDEARALANQIVEQLRAGADFAELAAQHSEDIKSREQGGRFGVVSATSPYAKEFKDAVLKLAPGEVSAPIRQAAGFYVAQVTGQTEREVREVREAIIQAIRQDHLVEFLDGLRLRFETEVRDEQFFLSPGTVLQGR